MASVGILDRGYSPAGAGEYRAVGYSPANKSAGALMRVNNKSALFTREAVTYQAGQ